jgi:hypothetical protein
MPGPPRCFFGANALDLVRLRRSGRSVTTIHTSPLGLDEVAAEVLAWAEASLRGETAQLSKT